MTYQLDDQGNAADNALLLQTTLDATVRMAGGAEIVLAAGATYGSVVLPARSRRGIVVLRGGGA